MGNDSFRALTEIEAGFADQALEPVAYPGPMVVDWHASVGSTNVGFGLLSAVRQASSQGTAIALDVNWRPTFWDASADPAAGPSAAAKAAIQPLLDQAALIKLAREEALWLFNTDDPGAIQQALPQRPDVVVTDGAAPVRWQLDDDSGRQVPFIPSVVDTTGAGDAFTAGLLHRWAAAPRERIRFAAACGALVCGGAGGIDPQPRRLRWRPFLER